MGFVVTVRVQSLVCSLSSCVVLRESFDLSVPQCSHLEIGDNNDTDLTALLNDLNKRINYAKMLEKGLVRSKW